VWGSITDREFYARVFINLQIFSQLIFATTHPNFAQLQNSKTAQPQIVHPPKPAQLIATQPMVAQMAMPPVDWTGASSNPVGSSLHL
jgi:hypothetical protein